MVGGLMEYPLPGTNLLLCMAINYCHKIYHFKDADGTDYTVLGVEMIDDEMLLEEIINYKDGENHDRITTFGIALIQAHFLDTNYVVALLKEKQNRGRRDSQKSSQPLEEDLF
jgi:hypothetical protein